MDWIIDPLIENTVKPACSFAKKHISYVICESDLVKELEDELKKLEVKKTDIDMRVREARGKGEDIVPSVNQWLEEVRTVIEEVNRFLEQEKLNSDNKCGFGQCFCSICDLYKTGKETANMLNMVKEKLQQAGEQCFTDVGTAPPPADMALEPAAYSKGFDSRESLLENIIEALKVKNMIGIHGMPGVGKTMLMHRLTAEVKSRNLFDEVGIATVSRTPDVSVIRNEIADRILHAKLDANSEEGKKDDLYRKLSALMHEQKRVLLVLDDAWEPLDLHQVGIPKPDKGFKIAMTSRHEKVCAQMGDKKPFKVRVLDRQEAWSLFRQELGDDCKILDSDEGHNLAKEMVEHFGGLPLALVTLARALIGEELPAWRDIARYLRERSLDKIDGMSDKVIGAIEVSFNYLRDKDAQFIFLLCCLFPEDWNIEVEVLMWYGNSLGLFGNLTIVQAMDRVERLTQMLKSRSLLLDGSSKKRTVRIHDVTRVTGLHIASKGKFDFLVKDYRGSRIDTLSHDMLIEKCAISISSKISIMDFFPQDHMIEYFNLQILRLHVIKDSDMEDFLPYEFSAYFFKGMGNLKVLEMCHVEISSFPTSLGSLKNNLRTMCLRHCMVKDFTKFGELTNLEILDMQGSRIYGGLYEAIQQMIGLRVLNLTSCRTNELFDDLVGRLSRLEALYMLNMANMDATKPNITSPIEVELLSHLEVLEVQVGGPEQLTNNFLTILGKLSSFNIWVSKQFMDDRNEIQEVRLFQKVLTFNKVTINELLQQRLGRLIRVANIFVLKECNDLPLFFPYGDVVSRNDLEFIIRGPATKTEELRHDEFTLFIKLEQLILDGLPGLKVICPPLHYVYLSKLNNLYINCCEMLPFAFNNLAAKQLRQLKYLRIMHCGAMEEIFTIDNATSGNPSSFEGINYEEIDDSNSIVLPSLEELYLDDMEKLKVFSAKDSSHGGQQAFFGEQVQLPRLKRMYMYHLPSCEKIWEGHHPKGSFGQLMLIVIRGCKELRNIFPTAVAGGLVQLLSLIISNCDKLEEVVVVESRNDAEEAEEEESRIIFPRLGFLQLSNLHSLRSFCSARCSTLEFPSLNRGLIEGNINMERFSYGSLRTPKLRDQDYLNTIVARQYEETKRAMVSKNSESNVAAS